MIWNKLAKSYDNLWIQKYSLAPTRKYILDYIQKRHDTFPCKSILDVGCGTGQCLYDIENALGKSEGVQLFGIDKSAEMIKHAQEKSKRIQFMEYNIDEQEDFSSLPVLPSVQVVPSLPSVPPLPSMQLVPTLPPLPPLFDIIICAHSLPYHQDQQKTIDLLARKTHNEGRLIFVHASINNFFDKCFMAIVETTAEKANYLSIPDFRNLLPENIEIEEEFIIRPKKFMPTISGFVLKKI